LLKCQVEFTETGRFEIGAGRAGILPTWRLPVLAARRVGCGIPQSGPPMMWPWRAAYPAPA
jgi:hypothetical protein